MALNVKFLKALKRSEPVSKVPKWIRSAWTDPVGSNLITAAILGLVGLIFAAFVWDWNSAFRAIGTWLVGYLTLRSGVVVLFAVLLPLAGFVAACYLLVQRRKTPQLTEGELAVSVTTKFEPFAVADKKFDLEWRIVRSVEEWLRTTPSYTHDASAVDGPFHAMPECLERLNVEYKGSEPYVVPRCPQCAILLFTAGTMHHGRAKSDVIEELRRQERQGKAVGPKAALEIAKYWNGIRMPPLKG
ncbi:MAG TPA: hypothetical protein VML92_06015 [Steroidobacteraceae bacterium]|nr:hypothetical protein [Steroidobacteraceae bacterium]